MHHVQKWNPISVISLNYSTDDSFCLRFSYCGQPSQFFSLHVVNQLLQSIDDLRQACSQLAFHQLLLLRYRKQTAAGQMTELTSTLIWQWTVKGFEEAASKEYIKAWHSDNLAKT